MYLIFIRGFKLFDKKNLIKTIYILEGEGDGVSAPNEW